MNPPMRRSAADQVALQLIEADVDIGFALVDEAKAYRAAGQSQFGVAAMNQAERIVTDIENRLDRLAECERGPFLPLLRELRNEIAGLRSEDSGE